MWKLGVALLAAMVVVHGAQAQTDTPTPPSIIVTVILVPATATDTPVPTETPTPTPGPSETPTPTPTSTPASSMSTVMEGTDGALTEGTLTLSVSAGEFMIAVLLFALLSGQVIGWALKMRGK